MRVRDISVVICAYTEDRWDQVCAAIESVRAQSLPSHEIVVVVDYNPALYKRLAAAMDDVVLVENREGKGLSGARNTGSAMARGEIIAFLDDDAVAHPDWLKFFSEAYENPAVMGVGGLTVPNWQTARPAWMPEEFYWVVGSSYARDARVWRPRPQPARRQHVVPPRGVHPGRRFPDGHRAHVRQAPARLRGDRVLHQAGPAVARRALDHGQSRRGVALRAGHQVHVPLLHPPLLRGRHLKGHGHRQRRQRRRAVIRAFLRHQDAAARRGQGPGGLPRGRFAGLGRAGAIIAGLGTTTFGFVSAKLTGSASAHVQELQPQAL